MSSAISFNLDLSKILLFVKELNENIILGSPLLVALPGDTCSSNDRICKEKGRKH